MTTQTLSSIAVDVVGHYHQAGQSLVRAYQAGVEQAERAYSERFVSTLNGRELPLVNEAVKSSLIEVQRHVATALVRGLRAGSDRVAEINDRLAERARTDIGRLADAVARAESAFEIKGSETLAIYGLPSAQFSLAVASAVSEGARRLGARVAATDVEEAVEVVDAQPVKRATKRARRG
jgi:hypothetical protein